ncbi:T9SS type A sorting domain-containing protein [Winogradskyella sp.]|uniref:T9SS type A sorting domain-containing protein n=1 Tax=Winogradskyella sp. TaxID=1883156 RepID=UPI003511F3DF
MKALFSTIILFSFVQQFQAQNNSGYRIIRSNLGSSGSSQTVETSNGVYKISQSIGQASVIGTFYNNGYYLRQGYQQPSSTIKSIRKNDFELRAKVYPNPFSQTLFISFSDEIINDISISIFDVEARTIYTQEFLPSQRIKIQIQNISSGNYFLKVASGSKQFNTKLIKI